MRSPPPPHRRCRVGCRVGCGLIETARRVGHAATARDRYAPRGGTHAARERASPPDESPPHAPADADADDAAGRACIVRRLGGLRWRVGLVELCSRLRWVDEHPAVRRDHLHELPRLDRRQRGQELRGRLSGRHGQAGRGLDVGGLRGGGADRPEQGLLRHVAGRPGAGRAAAGGRPSAEGRLLSHPEHQERRPALHRRLPLGPAHRLRQNRHRLPHGHGERTPHQLGRPLEPGPQVLRKDRVRRLRRGCARRGAQVQGLLGQ